jgi:hypothetical protein
MSLYEDPEHLARIEYEMARTWTKFRAGDTCRVVEGNVMLGELVTIKFPYAFPIDGKQSYITNETPCPFAEGELDFVKQDLYGGKKKGKIKSFDYKIVNKQPVRIQAIDQLEADSKLVEKLVNDGYCVRIPIK